MGLAAHAANQGRRAPIEVFWARGYEGATPPELTKAMGIIVYAWMQAVGIVNDHTAGCFRRKALPALERKAVQR